VDNDIANSLSVLIGSVKGGMVIYLLFILAGLVPLAIAYFGIKFGWNNLMAMSGGSGANLHSDPVPNVIPPIMDLSNKSIRWHEGAQAGLEYGRKVITGDKNVKWNIDETLGSDYLEGSSWGLHEARKVLNGQPLSKIK
jgi:hypothetical protein